jgi:septal ring factor EnvC (AmiA/AmiB activator)
LKAALAAKVAAVATTEEQLRQECAARQEAEGQLQQERAALADARSVLEREHAALEEVRTSLKEREADVSKLDGELIALSISNADQQRSLEEQSATVISLQQVVEAERRALEVEKKQVEGKSPLCFSFCWSSLRGSVPLLISFARVVQACSRRSRPSAELSRWKRSRLKVSRNFVSRFVGLPFGGPFPF